MKIVILADSISTQNSGIHYFGLQFVKRLISEFPLPDYTIIASNEISEFEHVEQIIVPVRSLPMHLRWRQLFTIPRKVKRLKPDCVIELAHFGPFNLPKKIKKVTVIHDLTPIMYPEYHDRMSTFMHKLLLPKILKNADSVICNTMHTGWDILAYKKDLKAPIYPIYPKLELQIINENPSIKKEYLLTIGTIEPRKNYPVLLNAFEKIAEKYPDLELIIIGKDGWKNEEFFSLLEKHPYKDRIQVMGYVKRNDMLQLISNCTLFVFTSLYEGFGIPIVEAMHFGKALVLSDIPTSREVANQAAIYFPASSPNDLANAVIGLITNKEIRTALEQESKDRYLQLQKIADKQLLNWYNSILA